MKWIVLKSKICRATLTGTDLDYQESVIIDEGLLKKANMLPDEQAHIPDISSGERS